MCAIIDKGISDEIIAHGRAAYFIRYGYVEIRNESTAITVDGLPLGRGLFVKDKLAAIHQQIIGILCNIL